MGFDVATFNFLLYGPGRFAEQWNTFTIPRDDTSSTGKPRLGRRSLDAAGALGLILHYLGSSMLEISLQQIFALVPATVSRYIKFAMMILLKTLQAMPEAKICFPKTIEELTEYTDLICTRHPLLRGAFASIDGLSLVAQVSEDPEIENATYNGWKSDHRISNILVFSPLGTIIAAVLNSPGSWHDSHSAARVYEKLKGIPSGFFLVADSAFPRGAKDIAGKIKTPVKDGDQLPTNPLDRRMLLEENAQLLSYRQTAEWGMRIIQGSFGRLRVPLPIANTKERAELLEIVCRLSNVRATCVGINQIRQVYYPTWRASEDERLWKDLRNMVFGDIRHADRVAKFHLTEQAVN
ncbi:hypothetical protein EYR40_003305 [Pleurotus pulmonarius]|nr:hypothetical protein EYR40_003305 [Pleurotus pulmonarius]KAF4606033.1 hypothetical protein EYR38_000078 [Pleurotus pulmonarius]